MSDFVAISNAFSNAWWGGRRVQRERAIEREREREREREEGGAMSGQDIQALGLIMGEIHESELMTERDSCAGSGGSSSGII